MVRLAERMLPANPTRSEKNQISEKENRKIVVSAFRFVHRGFSTDYLIANPELNAAFIDSCRKSGTDAGAAELSHDPMHNVAARQKLV